jgi:hypothetical protein
VASDLCEEFSVCDNILNLVEAGRETAEKSKQEKIEVCIFEMF